MNNNFNLNIANRIKDSAIDKAIELGRDAVESIVSPIYQLPKKVEPPPIISDDNENEEDGHYTAFDETPRLLPPSPVVENVKRSQDELQHRAKNKSKMWSELLSIIQMASKMGVAFASLNKGDKAYLNHWNAEIEKAETEGANLALPTKYYAVKARVDEFESEMLNLQLDVVEDDITEMLYESFLYDFQQKNKDNQVTPLSPWEALGQAAIIILGTTAKLLIIKTVLKIISQKNA